MADSPSDDDNIIGLFSQTLIPGQSIKRIYLVRCSNGSKRQVIVKEQSIVINNYEKFIASSVIATSLLSLEYEDVVLLTLKSGRLLALRILPDSDIPLVVAYMSISLSESVDVSSTTQYACCDPRGQFVALSAVDTKITLCRIDHSLDLSTCHENFFIPESRRTVYLKESLILDMCILYPETGDSADPTYLVVLNVTSGAYSSYARVTYRQLTSSGQSTDSTMSFALDIKDETPLNLIAVACNSGVIVRTTESLIYIRLSDIVSGNRNWFTHKFSPLTIGHFHDPFAASANSDTFYLATDDGKLYKVEVDKTKLSCTLFADLKRDLGCSFTLQAFDSVKGPCDGEISRSEYVKMVYGGDLILVQSIVFSTELDETGSPVFLEYENESQDMERTSLAPMFDGQLIEQSGKSELFCCSGLEEHGSIAHLKYCIKASLYLDGPKLDHVSNLFSVSDENSLFQYLVVSYPWMTAAYLVVNDGSTDFAPSLEEIPDESGLDYSKSTIAVGVTREGNVIQVVADEIRITNMEGEFFAFKSTGRIEKAAVQGEDVVVACQEEREFKLAWYHVEDANVSAENPEWISQVAQASITNEISFIRYIPGEGDQSFCLVGIHNGKIVKLNKNDSLIELQGSSWNNKIPHDATCTSTKDGPRYMISFRDGSCIICSMDSSHVLSTLHSFKMSDIPMNFFHTDDGRIWGMNGDLVCLYSETTTHPKPTVLVFEKSAGGIDISSVRSIISSYCPIQVKQKDPSSGTFLVIIVNKQLKFITLSKYPEPVILKIPLKRTPRRLTYVEHISAFGVALESKISDEKLAFVDPHKYRLLQTIYSEKSTLDSDETIFSLLQWKCTIDEKNYCFLVLGTGLSNRRGKIRIFKIKRSSGGVIEIKCLYCLNVSGSVLSMFQISNTAIWYSVQSQTDNTVCEAKLDFHGAQSFKLYSNDIISVKDAVLDMAWCPFDTNYRGYLFTAALKNPAFAFEVVGNHAFISAAETVSRNAISCLAVGFRQALLCDKSRWIALLETFKDNESTRSCKTISQIQMPSMVGRLREGKFLPAWLRHDADNYSLSSARKVVAIGIDGAVYGLTLLTKKQLQQLRMEISASQMNPLEETDLECSKWGTKDGDVNVLKEQVLKRELGESATLSRILCRFEL